MAFNQTELDSLNHTFDVRISENHATVYLASNKQPILDAYEKGMNGQLQHDVTFVGPYGGHENMELCIHPYIEPLTNDWTAEVISIDSSNPKEAEYKEVSDISSFVDAYFSAGYVDETQLSRVQMISESMGMKYEDAVSYLDRTWNPNQESMFSKNIDVMLDRDYQKNYPEAKPLVISYLDPDQLKGEGQDLAKEFADIDKLQAGYVPMEMRIGYPGNEDSPLTKETVDKIREISPQFGFFVGQDTTTFRPDEISSYYLEPSDTESRYQIHEFLERHLVDPDVRKTFQVDHVEYIKVTVEKGNIGYEDEKGSPFTVNNITTLEIKLTNDKVPYRNYFITDSFGYCKGFTTSFDIFLRERVDTYFSKNGNKDIFTEQPGPFNAASFPRVDFADLRFIEGFDHYYDPQKHAMAETNFLNYTKDMIQSESPRWEIEKSAISSDLTQARGIIEKVSLYKESLVASLLPSYEKIEKIVDELSHISMWKDDNLHSKEIGQPYDETKFGPDVDERIEELREDLIVAYKEYTEAFDQVKPEIDELNEVQGKVEHLYQDRTFDEFQYKELDGAIKEVFRDPKTIRLTDLMKDVISFYSVTRNALPMQSIPLTNVDGKLVRLETFPELKEPLSKIEGFFKDKIDAYNKTVSEPLLKMHLGKDGFPYTSTGYRVSVQSETENRMVPDEVKEIDTYKNDEVTATPEELTHVASMKEEDHFSSPIMADKEEERISIQDGIAQFRNEFLRPSDKNGIQKLDEAIKGKEETKNMICSFFFREENVDFVSNGCDLAMMEGKLPDHFMQIIHEKTDEMTKEKQIAKEQAKQDDSVDNDSEDKLIKTPEVPLEESKQEEVKSARVETNPYYEKMVTPYTKTDASKDVQISDRKTEELRLEALKEANGDEQVAATIFAEKTNHLKAELRSIKQDIIHFEKKMNTYDDIPFKYRGQHTFYQAARSSHDSAVSRYQELGGAVGANQFVVEGMSNLKHLCSFLDVYRSNIGTTILLESFSDRSTSHAYRDVFRSIDEEGNHISIDSYTKHAGFFRVLADTYSKTFGILFRVVGSSVEKIVGFDDKKDYTSKEDAVDLKTENAAQKDVPTKEEVDIDSWTMLEPNKTITLGSKEIEIEDKKTGELKTIHPKTVVGFADSLGNLEKIEHYQVTSNKPKSLSATDTIEYKHDGKISVTTIEKGKSPVVTEYDNMKDYLSRFYNGDMKGRDILVSRIEQQEQRGGEIVAIADDKDSSSKTTKEERWSLLKPQEEVVLGNEKKGFYDKKLGERRFVYPRTEIGYADDFGNLTKVEHYDIQKRRVLIGTDHIEYKENGKISITMEQKNQEPVIKEFDSLKDYLNQLDNGKMKGRDILVDRIEKREEAGGSIYQEEINPIYYTKDDLKDDRVFSNFVLYQENEQKGIGTFDQDGRIFCVRHYQGDVLVQRDDVKHKEDGCVIVEKSEMGSSTKIERYFSEEDFISKIAPLEHDIDVRFDVLDATKSERLTTDENREAAVIPSNDEGASVDNEKEEEPPFSLDNEEEESPFSLDETKSIDKQNEDDLDVIFTEIPFSLEKSNDDKEEEFSLDDYEKEEKVAAEEKTPLSLDEKEDSQESSDKINDEKEESPFFVNHQDSEISEKKDDFKEDAIFLQNEINAFKDDGNAGHIQNIKECISQIPDMIANSETLQDLKEYITSDHDVYFVDPTVMEFADLISESFADLVNTITDFIELVVDEIKSTFSSDVDIDDVNIDQPTKINEELIMDIFESYMDTGMLFNGEPNDLSYLLSIDGVEDEQVMSTLVDFVSDYVEDHKDFGELDDLPNLIFTVCSLSEDGISSLDQFQSMMEEHDFEFDIQETIMNGVFDVMEECTPLLEVPTYAVDSSENFSFFESIIDDMSPMIDDIVDAVSLDDQENQIDYGVDTPKYDDVDQNFDSVDVENLSSDVSNEPDYIDMEQDMEKNYTVDNDNRFEHSYDYYDNVDMD